MTTTTTTKEATMNTIDYFGFGPCPTVSYLETLVGAVVRFEIWKGGRSSRFTRTVTGTIRRAGTTIRGPEVVVVADNGDEYRLLPFELGNFEVLERMGC